MSTNEWEDFKKTVNTKKKDVTRKILKKKKENQILPKPSKNLPPDFDTILSKDWGNLEKNIQRKIFKSQLKISSTLDLHGRTVEESKILIYKFIIENYSNQNRLLLIICGKGKRLNVSEGWKGTGILNKKIPDWLNSKALFKKIVWFDFAPPDKGGKGAYIIYLKKFRE